MFYISHRSNLDGPATALHGENHPSSIKYVLSKGYDIEIDVWVVDGKYLLGHDDPQYEVDLLFLTNNNLWCHAKNLEALHSLLENNIHCFSHNIDFATITSKGFIWLFPGQPIIGSLSIAVMPEKIENYNIDAAAGICSDYIEKYKNGEK